MWALMYLAVSASAPQSLTDWLRVSSDPAVIMSREMARAEAAEAEGAAARWPAPTVRYSWSPAPIETRLGPQRHRLQVRQSLPWLGRRTAEARTLAAVSQHRARESERREAVVTEAVVTRFVALWALQRELEIIQGLVESRARALEVARSTLEGLGTSAPALARRELALALLRAQAVELEGRRQAAALALRRAAGWGPGEAQVEGWPARLERSVEASADPEVAVAQASVRTAQAGARAAAQRLRPDFGIGVGWQEVGGGPDAFSVQASLQIPLDFVAHSARMRAASARTRSAEAEVEAAQLSSVDRAARWRVQARAARATLAHFDDRVVPTARRVLALARAAWSAGTGGYEQVVEAEDELLNIELQCVRLKAKLRMVQGAEAARGRSPTELAAWLSEVPS